MAKRRSYFQKVLSQTWKETEWVPVIIEDMSAGIVIAIMAAKLKICQWDEFKELAFLIVGTAACGFVFGFIYRFIFVTTSRLHRELERKVKTLESKLHERGEEVPLGTEPAQDKPTYKNTAVITFLICLCAGLALLLAVQNSKTAQSGKSISIPKPLPVKIIPRPEPPPPPPIVSTQQLADVETQKQFENFNEGTGVTEDAASQIAKLKAEKVAKIESENRQKNLEIQKWWDVYLPYYQHSLAVLHDVLTSESTKTGDGIDQSVGYFQCLPPAIDPKIGEIKAAEIRFQKNTNMDFLVTIAGLNASGHRQLKISCSGGLLEMYATWGDKFGRTLHVYPDFEDYKDVPIDKANDLILESIKQLVAVQILSNTNPQIHLENKQ